MQTEQSTQNVKTLSQEQLQKSHDEFKVSMLHETIKDFYQIGGVTTPINHLLDMVQSMFDSSFSYEDADLNEDGTQKKVYQLYEPDELSNKLFHTFELIKFLTRLHENYGLSPYNPRNKKN